MAIHPTAIVDVQADIADDVEIGAYSIIGPQVRIDTGTWIGPHVVIEGQTIIGKNNRIFQFCSLGAIPQDKKYAGEPTCLVLGDNNTLREFCTVNLGTEQGGGVTRIGHDNWIMAYVHIAHDCLIGDQTIFANNATLGGHVQVGDWVILGGFTSVHQFCVIGEHAMTAFASAVAQDIPPFIMAHGNRAVPSGINSEGMKRRGFSAKQIQRVRQVYKILYRQGLALEEAKKAIANQAYEHSEIALFSQFFARSSRSIIR